MCDPRPSPGTLPEAGHKKTPHRGGVFFVRCRPAVRSATERAATLAGALGTLLGLVDAQRSAGHLEAVQGLDRRLGLRLRHVDEAEAARFAGFPVVDELY